LIGFAGDCVPSGHKIEIFISGNKGFRRGSDFSRSWELVLTFLQSWQKIGVIECYGDVTPTIHPQRRIILADAPPDTTNSYFSLLILMFVVSVTSAPRLTSQAKDRNAQQTPSGMSSVQRVGDFNRQAEGNLGIDRLSPDPML